jgi:hypothetical protein
MAMGFAIANVARVFKAAMQTAIMARSGAYSPAPTR